MFLSVKPLIIQNIHFIIVESLKDPNSTNEFFFSTETKSYRHVQNGTFYVQYIVDVFTKYAHEDHIEELFRKVNHMLLQEQLVWIMFLWKGQTIFSVCALPFKCLFRATDVYHVLLLQVLRRFDRSDMTGSYRQMACKDRASLAKLFYLFPGLWLYMHFSPYLWIL